MDHDLTDILQLALGCILKNGVYELSEKATVTLIRHVLRSLDIEPRDPLTNEEVIELASFVQTLEDA